MFPPGATIGMLSGGQLGRMFALIAQSMGYRVVVFDRQPDSPASQAANQTVLGDFDDTAALDAFAALCDVVTLEWENIPTSTVRRVAETTPVCPSAEVLQVAQDRRREKQTLADFGLPVTPFRSVDSQQDAEQAAAEFGFPIVLKTARSGYDGKGQQLVRTPEELAAACQAFAGEPLVAEQWITHRRELSVIVARNYRGETAVYPVFENRHEHHILDLSLCPAEDSQQIQQAAEGIATVAAESLGLVGLLCVELFETQDGQLLINEIAPRPHNSGHLTIEAAATSQFEQQVRAVCGLTLGATTVHRPAAMVNLLGDLWQPTPPAFENVFAVPEAHLHLYGKASARAGRKMGHITALADTPEEAIARAQAARDSLSRVAAT
ncbi:5-(carboxyamino)imidazole ribonucleotide synthase [Candidatus Laterigemmans baculatus]|uniref:5-(carboxyamino)imidazole ribonucleotide synthase n=1 Tax=Candidatus Laterigemmans baculatus TaxID=2770505 RepID=UPI001F35E608|nr:5-(carboxyamino)imidazole ribonucleotide synthase [Candidatus Laterigemmans baculatus]